MEDLLNPEKSKIKVSRIKRFYMSKYIHYVYASLIILSIFCIIWLILNYNAFNRNSQIDDIWFIIIELLICIIVGVDLFLRIYLIGVKKFFSHFVNILDFILSSFCLIEVIIAITDIFLHELSSIIVLVILIFRNLFMVIRILTIMKRSIQTKKPDLVILHSNVNRTIRDPPSMEAILKTNIENLKHVFRARLDTLGEEDEMLESSIANSGSIWKGRIPQQGL